MQTQFAKPRLPRFAKAEQAFASEFKGAVKSPLRVQSGALPRLQPE